MSDTKKKPSLTVKSGSTSVEVEPDTETPPEPAIETSKEQRAAGTTGDSELSNPPALDPELVDEPQTRTEDEVSEESDEDETPADDDDLDQFFDDEPTGATADGQRVEPEDSEDVKDEPADKVDTPETDEEPEVTPTEPADEEITPTEPEPETPEVEETDEEEEMPEPADEEPEFTPTEDPAPTPPVDHTPPRLPIDTRTAPTPSPRRPRRDSDKVPSNAVRNTVFLFCGLALLIAMVFGIYLIADDKGNKAKHIAGNLPGVNKPEPPKKKLELAKKAPGDVVVPVPKPPVKKAPPKVVKKPLVKKPEPPAPPKMVKKTPKPAPVPPPVIAPAPPVVVVKLAKFPAKPKHPSECWPKGMLKKQIIEAARCCNRVDDDRQTDCRHMTREKFAELTQ